MLKRKTDDKTKNPVCLKQSWKAVKILSVYYLNLKEQTRDIIYN